MSGINHTAENEVDAKDKEVSQQKMDLLKSNYAKERNMAQELEQLELLEHRYHALVEMKKKTASIFVCCHILWEVFRSIPWLSMLALVPSLFGAAICWEYKETLTDSLGVGMDSLLFQGSGYSQYIVEYLSVFLLVLVGMDVVVVLAAFGASGATREYIFGHEGHGCMYCLQVVAGTGAFCILLWMQVLCILSLFGVEVFVALPGYAFLQMAVQACANGSSGINAMVAAMQGMESIRQNVGSNFISDPGDLHDELHFETIRNSFSTFCDGEPAGKTRTVQAFGYFCLGIFVNVIGQVCQLVIHIANLEKIWMQGDIDAEEEQENIRKYYNTHHYGTTDI